MAGKPQTALTLVHELKGDRDRVKTLASTLEALGNGDTRRKTFPFELVPEVHFARWVVLEASKGTSGRSYAALLLFEANYDGDDDGTLIDAPRPARGGGDECRQ